MAAVADERQTFARHDRVTGGGIAAAMRSYSGPLTRRQRWPHLRNLRPPRAPVISACPCSIAVPYYTEHEEDER